MDKAADMAGSVTNKVEDEDDTDFKQPVVKPFKFKMKPISGIVLQKSPPTRVTSDKSASSNDSRDQSGFGTFDKKVLTVNKKDDPAQHKAKVQPNQSKPSIDLEALVRQTRITARSLTKNADEDDLKDFSEQGAAKSDDSQDTSGDEEVPGPKPSTIINNPESDSDQDIPGPKPSTSKEYDSFDELSDDEDDNNRSSSRYSDIPLASEIDLEHGSKPVSALALDPNGSRFVSGGLDYEIRYWDFQGMDSTFQPFRTTQPCECHPIKSLEFSSNGEQILVVSGMSKVKLVDRDGYQKAESTKGDQYISDQNNTKGHTAMLNDGCWHPRQKHSLITCSNDGTVRLWNAEDLKKQTNVIKVRSSGGLRSAPNVCRYSRDGRLIAAACSDGSIQMWDSGRPFVNTTHLVRDAHTRGTQISSLSFSYDWNSFVSRGRDNTLKVWDIRNLKAGPVNAVSDLSNNYEQTDCSFSPDNRLIMTGTSANRVSKEEMSCGELLFYDTKTFEKVKSLQLSPGSSVIRSLWHPKLNQILFSTSNGRVKVLYDDKLSDRGAKLCRFKNKMKSSIVSYPTSSTSSRRINIITPHALPLFKDDRKRSRKTEELKARKDSLQSRRPELPVTGPGQGGRLASAGSTYSSYIARNIAVKNKLDETLDPREAIIRHAKECADNPYWVAPAYANTQPKAIYAEEDEDSDDDDGPDAKKPHVPV